VLVPLGSNRRAAEIGYTERNDMPLVHRNLAKEF
jgi:hypothetical protein